MTDFNIWGIDFYLFNFMDTNNGYTVWSKTYDTVLNKTRDLEQLAQQQLLKNYAWSTCLELGCGTGKNTVWLANRSTQLIAVDFNMDMMQQAKAKVNQAVVSFVQANIQQPWSFLEQPVDVVCVSLVLEHIENLTSIFEQASLHLHDQGLFYIGELHPFKQYLGSKAKFNTENGLITIEQFTHHFSNYLSCAERAGFQLEKVKEFFHEEDTEAVPRILAFVFRKKETLN